MIKYVSARFFGGLYLAAAVLVLAAPAHAGNDEPAQLTEDVSDNEIAPPNGGGEERPEERSQSDDRGIESRSGTSPAPAQSSREDRVDREAAKRALLADPKPEKPNPLLDARGPDYYDKRAKELLKEDADSSSTELHPLMAQHPDSYVVVCTAGCPSRKSATIVSMLPKRDAAPVTAPRAAQPEISCVAGCGSGSPTLIASAPAAIDAPVMAATVGEWMTTVAKTAPGLEPPAPKASGSGDWMEKINRDREGAKAATALKAVTPAEVTARVPDAKPVVPDAKPAVPDAKPVAAATAPVAPVEAKLAVVATKPVVNPVVADAKPVVPDAKPVVADAKPAVADAKPVAAATKPMASLDAKPAVVDTKPVARPALTETKPVPAVEAKPQPPVEPKPVATAEAKITSVRPKPAPAAPQQMAALEAPKAPAAPMAVKPLTEGQAPAPVAKTEPSPPAAKAAPQNTKVAALAPPAVETPAPVAPAAPTERVISVLSEDKDMNAAIEKARNSIAAFWKSYDAPAAGEADHALKVAVAGNGTTEHFWLTRIKHEGGKLSGVISNQPQSVKTVKVGQRYEFTADMISDWTFKRNGKLVGNETMRVLLPRMPEQQASVYRQMYETP